MAEASPPSPPAVLPTSFHDRLNQMEQARDQRLSLLRAEKDLQVLKTRLLSAELSALRRAELRCLLLERRHAEARARILAAESEVAALGERYETAASECRAVRAEIGEVEVRAREREAFYEGKAAEMEEFRERGRKFLEETREEVQRMGVEVAQLQATLKELQGSDGCINNPDVIKVEARKSELLAMKDGLEKTLASNYQLRSLLQRQIQKALISQDQELKESVAQNVNIL